MTTAQQANSGDRWLYLLIGAGGLVVVLLVLARLEWRPFTIPSGAMEPTLQIGDYVFTRHYRFIEPQRGDIAVFLGPRNGSAYFVSRLIGLPGDQVQLREGTLYINGVATKREPQGEYADPSGKRGSLARFIETLPNGIAHSILLDAPHGPPPANPCDRQNEYSSDAENTCPFIVPADHYLMIGDNRDDSFDSRFRDYGFIARDGLVGRVDLVAWGSTASRIGTLVH